MNGRMKAPVSIPIDRRECALRTVVAIVVAKGGDAFVGTNKCLRPRAKCPRLVDDGGYEMCKEMCGQLGHAEIDALQKAGRKARGATLVLVGHNHLCKGCLDACKAAGVARVAVVDDLLVKRAEGRV